MKKHEMIAWLQMLPTSKFRQCQSKDIRAKMKTSQMRHYLCEIILLNDMHKSGLSLIKESSRSSENSSCVGSPDRPSEDEIQILQQEEEVKELIQVQQPEISNVEEEMGNQVILPNPPSPPNNLEKSYVNSANPQIFEAHFSKVIFKNKAALRQRLIQASLNEAMLKARLVARQAANNSGEKKGPWQEIDGIGDTDEKINEHDDVAEERDMDEICRKFRLEGQHFFESNLMTLK